MFSIVAIIIGIILFFLFLSFLFSLPYWVYFVLILIIRYFKGTFFNKWTLILGIIGIIVYKVQSSEHTFTYRKYYTNNQYNNQYNDQYRKYQTEFKEESEYDIACNFFGFKADTPFDEKKRIKNKLARKYHPDINKSPDAEEKMKEINSYWDIIERYES